MSVTEKRWSVCTLEKMVAPKTKSDDTFLKVHIGCIDPVAQNPESVYLFDEQNKYMYIIPNYLTKPGNQPNN